MVSDMLDDSTFDTAPGLIQRENVVVMLDQANDEITAIQRLWPRFEQLVGVRGRKMYAMVDTAADTYATCTPVLDRDDPAALGLRTGLLPGGWYLRGRISGEPPALYDRIGPAMQALRARVTAEPGRPLVEFYRRHDQVELWVPVPAPATGPARG